MKRFILLVAVVFAGCTNERTGSTPAPVSQPQLATPTSPSTTQSSDLPAGLMRVADARQVCMVNDQFMGRPQIPVEVEGRTYFGCCPICKEKLEKLAMRTAQDPVTGEVVDKAKAVIVQDATGKVMYFASEDTLRRYRS